MRISHIIWASLLAMIVAPPAVACHPVGPGFTEPAPIVFWAEAPPASQLKPGEVAIKVAFHRFSTERDSTLADPTRLKDQPAAEDLIITCFANPIYTIVDVLVGDHPDYRSVMLYGFGLNYYALVGENPILVGRLLPLKTTLRDGSSSNPDSPRYMLIARLPPQPATTLEPLPR